MVDIVDSAVGVFPTVPPLRQGPLTGVLGLLSRLAVGRPCSSCRAVGSCRGCRRTGGSCGGCRGSSRSIGCDRSCSRGGSCGRHGRSVLLLALPQTALVRVEKSLVRHLKDLQKTQQEDFERIGQPLLDKNTRKTVCLPVILPGLSRPASWQSFVACPRWASAKWSALCCGRRSRPCPWGLAASPIPGATAEAVPMTSFYCCGRRNTAARTGRIASPNQGSVAPLPPQSRWAALGLDPAQIDGWPRTCGSISCIMLITM